jgi:hypothetical protein
MGREDEMRVEGMQRWEWMGREAEVGGKEKGCRLERKGTGGEAGESKFTCVGSKCRKLVE